jgi:HD-GYP domain-containing protein (c-di-GMP phosphodiesterase class II)
MLYGSGYPQGLKGDGILMGARIITVADVVESMATHRPYRLNPPGLEAALDEITRGQRTLYNERVVEACLKLFAEEQYSAPDQHRQDQTDNGAAMTEKHYSRTKQRMTSEGLA